MPPSVETEIAPPSQFASVQTQLLNDSREDAFDGMEYSGETR